MSRAHMYMMQDVESSSGGLYATSGLIASSDFYSAPKASFYHYAAMMAWVANYSYVGDVNVAPLGVMSTCFKKTNVTSGSIAYALIIWSPTSNATVLRGAEVSVTSTACPVASPGANVAVVVPTEPLLRGNATSTPVDSVGAIRVDISEMPTLVLL